MDCLRHTEYTVRVVVEGDRSTPPAIASSTAVGKATSSKAKQAPKVKPAVAKPTTSKSKASSSKSTSKAISKAKPRVGIVSVPGMSKTEVARLNKQARASAAAMRKASCADSDSDDYGYSGLKGRSAAFWERELL